MKARWTAALLLLGACGAGGLWLFPEPAERLGEDPLLGDVIYSDDTSRTKTLRTALQGDNLVVVGHIRDGYAGEELSSVGAEAFVWRVDRQDWSVTALPNPTGLTSHANARIGRSLDPDAVVLLLDDSAYASVARIHDGGSWRDVPLDVSKEAPTQVLYQGGKLLLGESNRIRVGADALSLREIGPGLPGAYVVAWSGDTVQVVWADGSRVCTGSWSAVTGAGSSEACIDVPITDYIEETAASVALSGTPNNFQALATVDFSSSQVLHFSNGNWALGDVLPVLGMSDHPGSRVGLVSEFDAASQDYDPQGLYLAADHPTYYRVEEGAFVDKAIEDFFVETLCECNRSIDPTCDCTERTLPGHKLMPLDDGSGALLVSLDVVDARLNLYVREIEGDGSDPLHPGMPCDLECISSERCDLGAGGEPFCERFDTLLDPEGGDQRVFLHLNAEAVGEVDPATWFEATLTAQDPTTARADLTSVLPNLSATLDPFSRYSLTVQGVGYRTLSFDVQTEGVGFNVDLGDWQLNPGAFVGVSGADEHSSVFFPDGAMLVFHDGRWQGLSTVGDEVRARVLMSGGSASMAPEGSSAVLAGAGTLKWVEPQASDWTVLGSWTGPADGDTASWSSDGQRVALFDRATGAAVVLELGTGGITELLSLTTAGGALVLSGDGTQLARVEGTEVGLYSVDPGSRTTLDIGATPVFEGNELRRTSDGGLLMVRAYPVPTDAPVCKGEGHDCAYLVGPFAGPLTPIGVGGRWTRAYTVAPDGNHAGYLDIDGFNGAYFVHHNRQTGVQTRSDARLTDVSAPAVGVGAHIAVMNYNKLVVIDVRDGSHVYEQTFSSTVWDWGERTDGSVVIEGGCVASCHRVVLHPDGTYEAGLVTAPGNLGVDRWRPMWHASGADHGLWLERLEGGVQVERRQLTSRLDATSDVLATRPEGVGMRFFCYDRAVFDAGSGADGLEGVYCLAP